MQGYPYKLFGLFPSRLHLYGVDEGGTIFLLGTDKFGRDLLGRIFVGGAHLAVALDRRDADHRGGGRDDRHRLRLLRRLDR